MTTDSRPRPPTVHAQVVGNEDKRVQDIDGGVAQEAPEEQSAERLAEVHASREAGLRRENESVRAQLAKAQAEVRMGLLECERVEDEKKSLQTQLDEVSG